MTKLEYLSMRAQVCHPNKTGSEKSPRRRHQRGRRLANPIVSQKNLITQWGRRKLPHQSNVSLNPRRQNSQQKGRHNRIDARLKAMFHQQPLLAALPIAVLKKVFHQRPLLVALLVAVIKAMSHRRPLLAALPVAVAACQRWRRRQTLRLKTNSGVS